MVAGSHCNGTMTTTDKLLNERYRVLSHLGGGGQGSVWLAEDTVLERRVALKELILACETIGLAESRARAMVEARAMARVRHRCIVHIHDIFFLDQSPWIVMEYISGRSLADVIEHERPGERAIAAIGLSVLQGLQAVHAARVVHRDVKPANILADQDGAIYLVDFGIAKLIEDAAPRGQRQGAPITGRGRVVGTPEYMSPEQLAGHAATPASDLWSLGVTLFYALQGYTPFARASGQAARAVRDAILYEEPHAPASRGPLMDVVLRLLEKDPARRPTAAQLGKDLEGILNADLGGPSRMAVRSPQPPRQPLSKTRPYTRAGQALDEAELSRRDLADAVRGVNQSGTDSGVAVLLGKPDLPAAQIISDCSPDVAAELITGIAASQPRKAGAILQMLSVTKAGRILDYVTPATGTAIIAAMPAGQRARVLSQSDPRAVAEVIMRLPAEVAAQLTASLPEKRAVTVLGHVRPATVAAIVNAVPGDLRTRLLRGFAPDIRLLVEAHL
jgi:eukaryotic-like serine/threonine-protein kinase